MTGNHHIRSVPGRLVFIHIPKSAGSSLSNAIRENYSPDVVFPGSFFNHFNTLTEAQIAEYNVFMGHLGYTQARNINGRTVTVLRHPVDRIISLYHFFRELDDEVIKEDEGAKLAKRLSLEEYVQCDDPSVVAYVENTQTWQLAFDHTFATRQRLNGITDTELLGTAVDHVQQIDVVGLFEHLEATLLLLERELSLNIVSQMQSLNRTKKRPAVADVPQSTTDRILERTQLDSQLYAVAATGFYQRMNLAAERRDAMAGASVT